MNKGWFIALLTGLGVVTLATLPPFVGETAQGYLMQAFEMVCHQLPGRSPHVDGVQLAVCHRCYGIYLGLPLASLIYLGVKGRRLDRRVAPLVLGLSVVPMALDWGGDAIGLFTNTAGSRIVTGLLFGVVAGLFFVWSMVDSFLKKRSPGPDS
ncbi:MAG: putative membrane protein [Rhodothermales bacterium]